MYSDCTMLPAIIRMVAASAETGTFTRDDDDRLSVAVA